jgi:hypothetical protein
VAATVAMAHWPVAVCILSRVALVIRSLNSNLTNCCNFTEINQIHFSSEKYQIWYQNDPKNKLYPIKI